MLVQGYNGCAMNEKIYLYKGLFKLVQVVNISLNPMKPGVLNPWSVLMKQGPYLKSFIQAFEYEPGAKMSATPSDSNTFIPGHFQKRFYAVFTGYGSI